MNDVVFHRKVKITINSFFVALFLAFAASYLFYAFFYLLRDLFRIISVDNQFAVFPQLTSRELFFNNLFFSSIASILGAYVFLMVLNKIESRAKASAAKFKTSEVIE